MLFPSEAPRDTLRRRSAGFGFIVLLPVLACAASYSLGGCRSSSDLRFGAAGGDSTGASSSGAGGAGGVGGMGGAGGGGGAGGAGGAALPGVLPVLEINTNGAKIVEEVKVSGTLIVIEDHDGTLQDLGGRPHTFEGPIGIEIRGSTSAGFPKKSYGVETRDELGQDVDTELLGMPPESDWVLHGPYSDKTFMRDKLTYDLGRALGRYASRTRYAELFVNGEYEGVYVLLEKIKRGLARVAIPKVAPSAAMGDITGGYILVLEAGNPAGGWVSAAGTAWQYHYPKAVDITAEQAGYIQGYIDDFEYAMLGPSFSDPVKGYQAWIDVPSFVDFAIMMELSRNVDGYRKSTYMYKDADVNGGRMYLGPIWDFNLAFGNADYCDGFKVDEFVYTGGGCSDVVAQIPAYWYDLMADPTFTKALRCRWESLRSGVFSDASILERIDGYRKEVEVAEPRDHATWGNLGVYVWPNAFIGATFDEEIGYLKSFALDRAAWLDQHMPGVCP